MFLGKVGSGCCGQGLLLWSVKDKWISIFSQCTQSMLCPAWTQQNKSDSIHNGMLVVIAFVLASCFAYLFCFLSCMIGCFLWHCSY